MPMPKPLIHLVAEAVRKLGPELREDFEERAAIMEYDGGLAREWAECLAVLDVLNRHPDALTGLRAFQVRVQGETRYLVTTDDERARGQHLGHVFAAPVDLAQLVRQHFGGTAYLVR